MALTFEDRARANRAQADRNQRAARQPIGNTTPAHLPVGVGSSLTGMGREVQKRSNANRHQINRQKRAQRLLDRRARKGDVNAALLAEKFGARMMEEGGPLSNVTGAGEIDAMSTRQLQDEARLRQLLRGDGMVQRPAQFQDGPFRPQQSPGAQFQDGPFRPQQSPGAQNVPPADATQDSETSGSASSTMREVPESGVATAPVETQELPETAEGVPTTNLPPDPFETAATEVGFEPEALQPPQQSQPDAADPLQRAKSELGVIMSGTVPMVKRDGKFVELPGGYAALTQRAEINRMQDRLGELQDSGFNEEAVAAFKEREAQRAQLQRTGVAAIDGERPTAAVASPVSTPTSVTGDMTSPDFVKLPAVNLNTPEADPTLSPAARLTFEPSVGAGGLTQGKLSRMDRADEAERRDALGAGGRLGEDARVAADAFLEGNKRAAIEAGRAARAVGRFDARATRATGQALDSLMRFDQRATAATLEFLGDFGKGFGSVIPGTKTPLPAGHTSLSQRIR